MIQPWDDDPLTIGYLGDSHQYRWSTRQIVLTIVGLFLIGILLLPLLLRLLS